jgi:hypothetical protein
MQDRASELPRILLLRASVNRDYLVARKTEIHREFIVICSHDEWWNRGVKWLAGGGWQGGKQNEASNPPYTENTLQARLGVTP